MLLSHCYSFVRDLRRILRKDRAHGRTVWKRAISFSQHSPPFIKLSFLRVFLSLFRIRPQYISIAYLCQEFKNRFLKIFFKRKTIWSPCISMCDQSCSDSRFPPVFNRSALRKKLHRYLPKRNPELRSARCRDQDVSYNNRWRQYCLKAPPSWDKTVSGIYRPWDTMWECARRIRISRHQATRRAL